MKTLLVAPNPYLVLDEDGDPCGYVLRVDLRRQSSRPILLGAQRVLRNGKLKVSFSDEPQQVPDLPAYRRHLRTGEILPADPSTARIVGLPWVPLADALARHREASALRFLAETGDLPPWAAASPDPTDPTPPAEAP